MIGVILEKRLKGMEKTKIEEMNIYEKLQAITNEIGVIEKNLKVEISSYKSYKAVSERDVLDGVKPLENKYRVYSYPSERKVIESDVLVKETEYNGKTTKTNQLYMRLEITYRFVNIDKPEEYVDIKSYGDGIDTGDKATGKAMTYADKYALMKAYKLSTGDDPDKDASPKEGYAKRENFTDMPIQEGQKQWIKAELSEEEIKKSLTHYGVKKLSDLNFMQAEKIREAKEKRDE